MTGESIATVGMAKYSYNTRIKIALYCIEKHFFMWIGLYCRSLSFSVETIVKYRHEEKKIKTIEKVDLDAAMLEKCMPLFQIYPHQQ